jgi:hypothetical protein
MIFASPRRDARACRPPLHRWTPRLLPLAPPCRPLMRRRPPLLRWSLRLAALLARLLCDVRRLRRSVIRLLLMALPFPVRA